MTDNEGQARVSFFDDGKPLLALNVERDPQELLARLGRMASWLRTRLRLDAASVAIAELVDWAAVCMADVMPPEMVVRARRVLLQEENESMMALARTAQEWKRAWLAEGHTKDRQKSRRVDVRRFCVCCARSW